MFYFITGKPGNGKTLYTIATVHDLQKVTGRPVYYHGIPLTEEGAAQLKWELLPDPNLWWQCPNGSIIVVDECQTHWRVRSRAADVPKAITEVETHRHKGFDLFYMSQDPLLVDTNLRKLVWEHTHIKRSLGLERATLYRWKQRVASPDSKSEYKDAISTAWLYPKEYYGFYKSAELHTAKADIPWRKVAIVSTIAIGLIAALLYVFKTGWGKDEVKPSFQSPVIQSNNAGSNSLNNVVNPWSAERWVPRVVGRAETAPAFDRLQVVRAQPVPAGCSQYVYGDGTVDCECRTGQGSVIDMTVRQCMKLVKKGWFDPSRPMEDKKAINIAQLNARDRAIAGVVTQSTQVQRTDTRLADNDAPDAK